MNLYVFVHNDSLHNIDHLGLWRLFEALRDAPTGEVDTKFVLSKVISTVTDSSGAGRAANFVDWVKNRFVRLSVGGHIGRSKYIHNDGHLGAYSCVWVRLWGQAKLPGKAYAKSEPKGFGDAPGYEDFIDTTLAIGGSFTGVIEIEDCRCYKRKDVKMKGDITLNARLGLGLNIPEVAGMEFGAKATVSVSPSSYSIEKESGQIDEDLSLQFGGEVFGGLGLRVFDAGTRAGLVIPIDEKVSISDLLGL